MATNKDFIIKNGLVVGGDITGVTDLYVDDQIISTGDTNTYLQFHNADQFRVVVGGAEKFEVNSTGINVTGTVTATGGNSTNWNTAYGWGNHGSESYITNSTASLSADKITSGVLNSDRILGPANGDWWNGGVVKVGTDGVMEVGKYLDFHTADSGGNTDYDLRVTASAGALTVGGTISATGGNSGNWNTAYTYSQTDANVLRKRTDIPGSANLNTYTAIGLYHQNANSNAASGSNYPISQAGMLTVTTNSIFTYQTYQGYATNGTYKRKYYNGTWQSWHLVYDSGVFTNNSANWNTAYTYSQVGHLPLAGGTMTGGLTITATGNAIAISSGAPQILFNDTSGEDDFYIHVNSNRFYVLVDRDESGNYETPHPLELNASNNLGYAFGHRLFTEAYHPNADVLTTARTINGVSFNGSANITVADATKLPLAGGTMTGVLTINSTNDNQILLTSPSSWTGIGFNDSAAGAAEYIWHNGINGTFAIGGGGSNIANKKLHVHGGMTIGSGYAATAVSANSLNVQGDINSGNYITATRLRVGDGTDGFFYSDTAGRTAFAGGDFYIQTSVANCYMYATNTFMGAASGDTILFRGNVVTADNWGINAAGLITSSGIRTGATAGRVKLGIWNDNTYGIGMESGYTYGGLNNDYAMTFQMNDDNDRGFWWGDAGHTNAQGAMALTTQGRLTVAEGIRVGYGATDITIPSAGLVVSGAATFSGRTIMGGDGARVQIANAVAADTSNLYTLAVGSQTGNKSILAARDINTTAGSYQINGTAVIDSSRNMFANDITALNIERASSRVSTSQYYPIGHFSSSENVLDIDPTWSTNDLQAFFQTTAVAWTADATAPAGYAITITGGVSRTVIGHRYIPVEQDDEFYMECWIKNVGTAQTHYMGSVEYNENFSSLGGNPGSYGYWVMLNSNPGSSWTKVSGTISGFGTATGQFKVGTKYWSPQALFNYGAGSGTRACVISGLKIIRTKVVGNRTFTGDITAASGTLTVQKAGSGGGQIGLGDWTNTNPIGISEGLWNTVTTDNDFLTVYTRSSFNIRGYGGGTTHWLALTNSNLNLVQGQSLSLAGTTVIDSSRNFTGQSYSGVANNASFASNTVTSYGSWKTNGSKGGYDGIVFDDGGDVAIMFDVSGNGGFYRAPNASWYSYHHVGNSCTGFGTSTTSSSYEIYVSGAIYATENITAYSDRRVKENITTIDNPLTKVEGLRGVYYNKIDDEKKTKQIGFIAQEVDQVVPELVTYAEDVDQYGVNYGNTTALLVEAIKELSQQVKDQQKQIDELKQEVASLRSKI